MGSVKEIDLNLLEGIAKKNNLTTRQLYDIYSDVEKIVRVIDVDEPDGVTVEFINSLIKGSDFDAGQIDKNKISDGYHTFGELYDHRIELWIVLCKLCSRFSVPKVWKSQYHSDGSSFKGWFMLGMNTEPGRQITYHLPESRWDDCIFAETYEKAPHFDGHTAADVLQRLKGF